jgi:hypothetical protein
VTEFLGVELGERLKVRRILFKVPEYRICYGKRRTVLCGYENLEVNKLYRTAGPINSPADPAQISSSMGTLAKVIPERAFLSHHLPMMSGSSFKKKL